jgi:tetratricopeptide (TPR) repeat protein
MILLVTALLYYPNTAAEFTNWDDPLHITENPQIKSLSWHAVGQLFVPNTEYMYHPLTMLSYLLEWNLGNGSPAPYHLTSIILHLINIVLVYYLIAGLSGSTNTALIVTLIFAIHPVNAETVSWISARKDILYSVFFLSGLLFYLRYAAGGRRKGWLYAAVILSFIFGLLSKPTMVAFPLALVLMDWWKGRGYRREVMMEKIPFVVISLGYGIFTMLLSAADTEAFSSIGMFPWHQRLMLICYASVFYLGKILFPVHLSAVYSFPMLSPDGLPVWYIAAPIILVILFAGIIIAGKRFRPLLFGAAWYCIPLLLVIQIIPYNNASLVADRYAYIASIGIIVAVVSAVKYMIERYAQRDHFISAAAGSFLVIAVLLLSAGTAQRVAIWKDSYRLFTDVIEKDPNIWLAYGNRAIARILNGDFPNAITDVNTAIALNPQKRSLYSVRGSAYNSMEEYAKAVSDFDSVTFSRKVKHQDYFNKATALYHLGRIDSALHYLRRARMKDSTFARAYLNLGYITLKELNDPSAALRYFDTTAQYDATNWETFYFRATAQNALGAYDKAVADMSEAMVRNPQLATDTLIAQINDSIDRTTESIGILKQQIDRSGPSPDALKKLAGLYRAVGDTVRARNAQTAAAAGRSKEGYGTK